MLAVLSALKGLQDKIRKLELERAQAEKNLKSLATETDLYKVSNFFPTSESPKLGMQSRIFTSNYFYHNFSDFTSG